MFFFFFNPWSRKVNQRNIWATEQSDSCTFCPLISQIPKELLSTVLKVAVMLAKPSLLQSQVEWLLPTSRSKTKFFNCNLPFFPKFWHVENLAIRFCVLFFPPGSEPREISPQIIGFCGYRPSAELRLCLRFEEPGVLPINCISHHLKKWHFYSFALCVSQSEGCDCSDCWVQSADTYTLIKVQLMTSGTFFFLLTHCQPRPFSMVFRLPVKSRQAGKHLMEMIQSSERCDRLKHRHRREGFANNVEDIL